jgi:hypothetical protein
LKSENVEEFTMVAEKDPGVKKAVEVLMELSEDEKTQIMAEKRWIWLMDQHNREMHQYNKGLEKGWEEAEQKAAQNKAQFMENLRKLGVSDDLIAAAQETCKTEKKEL